MSNTAEMLLNHERDDPRALNLLAAYADGRLDADERRVLVRHLTDCDECRATFAVLVRASTPAPAATKTRAGTIPVWARVALPLAATLVIAVVSFWIVRPIPSSPSPTAPAARSQTATGRQPVPGVVQPSAKPSSPEPQTVEPNAPDTTRSASDRIVGTKRFRLVAGEWIDASFDPAALLPTVTVSTTAERDALLERIPALAPYARLGRRVTVVSGGTVYRFDLPSR